MEYWASFAVINLATIIAMYLLQNIRLNVKEKKIYLCYIISSIFLIINYEFSPMSYRVIFNCLLYIALAYVIFKKGVKSSFILGLMIVVLNIISEVIFAGISYPLINHVAFFDNNALSVFFQNLIMGILLCLICLSIRPFNFYSKTMQKIDRIRKHHIMLVSVLLVVIFNFFMWLTYFVSIDLFNIPSLSYIGSTISLFSVVLVFSYLNTNNKYAAISEKYNLSLNNIKQYEDMIEQNRINNHEVRNQFLMLRNMSRNKKMTAYIDSILDNSLSDNEELLNEVLRIPSGGLRGLVYSKMLFMKEKGIHYELYVDKRINIKKINEISDKCMIDICKIIGVFLDNAIEALEDAQEKNITVEFYLDKKDVVISITNNFEGFIDIEKIEESGYTTKSAGHGYGLKLVKEILKSNSSLENYKEIYEDNFTQNLKIKM